MYWLFFIELRIAALPASSSVLPSEAGSFGDHVSRLAVKITSPT